MDTGWRGRMIAPLVAMLFLTAPICAQSQICGSDSPEDIVSIGESGVIASASARVGSLSRRRLSPAILAQIGTRPEVSHGLSLKTGPDGLELRSYHVTPTVPALLTATAAFASSGLGSLRELL